ncbi:MAG: ParB N-terminal domain-containing protein [Alphaproteobacteria bacterium]|nr:ParB N-terminal domain-containing protein [Alphaproteobacteria bacterium]
MEIDNFIVSDIRVGEDRRVIDPKTVEALAKSIEDIGLQTPITVWAAGDDGGGHSAVHLVAGLHRLEAYKKLGVKLIEAFWTSGGELDRDLWQIDENLMRSDLTAGERAEHISRRGKIIKARKKLSANLANNSKGGPKDTGQVEFVAETAAMTMKSIRAVARDKRRGDNIAPDVMEAIKDMPAYKIGAELDALASLSQYPAPMVADSEQTQALRRVKSGASKTFREAKAFIRGEAVKQRADADRAMKATIEAECTGQDRKEKRKEKHKQERIDKFSMVIMLIGQYASFLDDMDLPCLDDPEVAQEAVDDLKTARRQLGKVIPRVQDTNHLGGMP